MDKKRSISPIKLYALLVSAAAMIAVLVSLSLATNTFLKKTLITEDEYLLTRGSYFDSYSCEIELGLRNNAGVIINKDRAIAAGESVPVVVQPKGVNTIDETIVLTQDEITQCKAKQREKDLAMRSYEYKDSLIGSATWFVVSLLILLVHVPTMMGKRKKKKVK